MSSTTRIPTFAIVFLATVFAAFSGSDVFAQPRTEPFPDIGTQSADESDGGEAEDTEEPTPAVDAANPLTDLPDPDGAASRRTASHWLGRNKFIRSHWVRLTPSGELKGNISLLQTQGGTAGASSLTVSIYRKGEKVTEAVTDENGGFVIPNMTSGVYSLIARGESGFAAYGLHAIASLNSGQASHAVDANVHFAQAIKIQETLQISTAAVPPTFNQLKAILKRDFTRIRSNYIPREAYSELIQEAETEKAPGATEEEGAEKLRGLAELEKNATDKTKSEAATSLSIHDVPLEPHNQGLMLRGRLYGIDPDSGRSVEIEAESTTITLIQNDKRLATTAVRAEGEFDFYGLKPGIYSLVAIGNGGFGAVAFRAVKPKDNQANVRDSQIHLVQNDLDDLLGPNNAAPGIQANNLGAAFPFAMALIDDPIAIKDAVNPIQTRQFPVAQGDIMGPEFGFNGGEFVGQPMGEMIGGEFVGGEFLQPGAIQSAPALMGAPPAAPAVSAPPAQTFSGTVGDFGRPVGGGGGGGFSGIGGIAGIAGGIAGITAIGIRDNSPVSPSSPNGVMTGEPVIPRAPPTPVRVEETEPLINMDT